MENISQSVGAVVIIWFLKMTVKCQKARFFMMQNTNECLLEMASKFFNKANWRLEFFNDYYSFFHYLPKSYLTNTDYGRPVRKSPSLNGRKSTPTPKFLGTPEAYFVCHISPNFQISMIYALIGCL